MDVIYHPSWKNVAGNNTKKAEQKDINQPWGCLVQAQVEKAMELGKGDSGLPLPPELSEPG